MLVFFEIMSRLQVEETGVGQGTRTTVLDSPQGAYHAQYEPLLALIFTHVKIVFQGHFLTYNSLFQLPSHYFAIPRHYSSFATIAHHSLFHAIPHNILALSPFISSYLDFAKRF